MFTSSQLLLMFIITELLIWHTLTNALATIRCCAMAKTYQKEIESGLCNSKEIKNENEEEKEDEWR